MGDIYGAGWWMWGLNGVFLGGWMDGQMSNRVMESSPHSWEQSCQMCKAALLRAQELSIPSAGSPERKAREQHG